MTTSTREPAGLAGAGDVARTSGAERRAHPRTLFAADAPLAPVGERTALDGAARDAFRTAEAAGAARAELCVACMVPLERYFMKVLRDPQDAEDATQQVLALMLKALPRWHPGSLPFDAWLFTIARRHAIDRARTHGRTEATGADAISSVLEDDPDQPSATGREQRDALSTLIAPLPLDQQRVLVLIYVHDFTPARTGRVLGHTESWVRQTHKRARDSLRGIIDAQAGGGF